MKLHPKAKAALKYYNAHRKNRDPEKCDFGKAAMAIDTIREYAPEIAKRIDAPFRTIPNGWWLYLGAEFSIHLESEPEGFLDTYYNIGCDLAENPDENLTEFLNDIPF